jgi:CTP synthase
MRKYIFVSGGVISGIGKGIAASSIGVLIKSLGFSISMIKADPYMNVDAGTMNPLEHGETFVLEDGFETDMDIGTYERFTGELFTRPNSMTSGAVFDKVIKDERALAYEGKWVSIDYHVPETIITWITDVAQKKKADITIIEVGGTVGEIGNKLFLEANRVMKVLHPNDVIHIHLSYLPVPGNLGEMKSKPVQMSVKELQHSGINPEFLIARSEHGIDSIRMEKLSSYCTVKKEHVISAPDVKSIYEVPIGFQDAKFGELILKELHLKAKPNGTICMDNWRKKVTAIKNSDKTIKLGMIAKYYKSGNYDLKDSYASVIEAVNHACWAQGIKAQLEWIVSDDLEKDTERQKKLAEFDGIIVPQGWGSRGVEGKIKAVEIARVNKVPYLGLCFGMQMAVIEYSRNVLGLKNANSEEADTKTKYPVIHVMEHQKALIKQKLFGGTIRLGAWPCLVKKNTQLAAAYADFGNSLFESLPMVQERHRHRYEVNNDYVQRLEKAGLIVSGTSPDNLLVEAIEIPKAVHPFFVGTQYHPELKSHFLEPHPLFMAFVSAIVAKKQL